MIRDVLTINNLELLDDVKTYVRQLTKIHQRQCMLNVPTTVEELKESVERGLADIKAGRRTPSEDVFRELEKKYL